MKFSDNLKDISESGTFKFFSLMKEKIAQGEDIISLVAGELDENTPIEISRAGIEAITSGFTRYTENIGLLELRQAICKKLKRDNDLYYEPQQILVSSGSKQAIFNIIFSLCGPGDEVIIFSPYYPSYPEIVKLARAKPVIIPLSIDNSYEIDVEQLRKKITRRTKMIIINSPNNPTGALIKPEIMEQVSELVCQHNLYLLSDEIYEKIIYNNQSHFTPAQLLPEVYERTIVINGFSKTYAMTGWRVGYAAAVEEIISKAAIVQSHTTSNASAIAQRAALTALLEGEQFIKTLLPDLKVKRQMVIDALTDIPNLKLHQPNGAFYFMCDLNQAMSKINNSEINSSKQIALYLLNEHNVACVPGSAFGSENSIRISISVSEAKLKSGLTRLKTGLNQLFSA